LLSCSQIPLATFWYTVGVSTQGVIESGYQIYDWLVHHLLPMLV
jgi:hypothetical protein